MRAEVSALEPGGRGSALPGAGLSPFRAWEDADAMKSATAPGSAGPVSLAISDRYGGR